MVGSSSNLSAAGSCVKIDDKFGKNEKGKQTEQGLLTMADCTNLGKRIRAMRSKKNITQERLGEMIGVGTTHVSQIETGNTMPSMKTFVKIINALECSADELLSEE